MPTTNIRSQERLVATILTSRTRGVNVDDSESRETAASRRLGSRYPVQARSRVFYTRQPMWRSQWLRSITRWSDQATKPDRTVGMTNEQCAGRAAAALSRRVDSQPVPEDLAQSGR